MGGSRFGFLGLAVILVLAGVAGCTGATQSPSTQPNDTASPTLAAAPTPTPRATNSEATRATTEARATGMRCHSPDPTME
jgi:hypothetical protein